MSIINVTSKYFISTSKRYSGKSAIQYLENDKPHSVNALIKERNERASCNCLDLQSYLAHQTEQLKCANKVHKNSVALFSIVQSFDPAELNYRHVADIDTCHKMGTAIAKLLAQKYPNRTWAVFTQADGVSHHLHNHILFFNYDRNLQAIGHTLSWKKDLKPINEAVTRQYLTSQESIKVREKDWSVGDEPLKIRYTRKHTNKEKKLNHIRTSVNQALNQALTREQFTRLLEWEGVRILARKNNEDPWFKKSGDFRKSLTFEYQGLKVRSNTLLGLSTQDIAQQIAFNADEAQKVTNDYYDQRSKNAVSKKFNLSRIRPSVKDKTDPVINDTSHLSRQDYINTLRRKQQELQEKLNSVRKKQDRLRISQQLEQVTAALNNLLSKQLVTLTKQVDYQLNKNDKTPG